MTSEQLLKLFEKEIDGTFFERQAVWPPKQMPLYASVNRYGWRGLREHSSPAVVSSFCTFLLRLEAQLSRYRHISASDDTMGACHVGQVFSKVLRVFSQGDTQCVVTLLSSAAISSCGNSM